MSKLLYFKPKSGIFNLRYEKVIQDFVGEFGLEIKFHKKKKYIAENDEIIASCLPYAITCLVDENDRAIQERLRSYFYN